MSVSSPQDLFTRVVAGSKTGAPPIQTPAQAAIRAAIDQQVQLQNTLGIQPLPPTLRASMVAVSRVTDVSTYRTYYNFLDREPQIASSSVSKDVYTGLTAFDAAFAAVEDASANAALNFGAVVSQQEAESARLFNLIVTLYNQRKAGNLDATFLPGISVATAARVLWYPLHIYDSWLNVQGNRQNRARQKDNAANDKVLAGQDTLEEQQAVARLRKAAAGPLPVLSPATSAPKTKTQTKNKTKAKKSSGK